MELFLTTIRGVAWTPGYIAANTPTRPVHVREQRI
jgi:hypothetical protein